MNPRLAGKLPPSTVLRGRRLVQCRGRQTLARAARLGQRPAMARPARRRAGRPAIRAELLEAARPASDQSRRSAQRHSLLAQMRPLPGRSGVQFEATMTNVDTKPRRWGIWAHTQLDAAKRGRLGFQPSDAGILSAESAQQVPARLPRDLRRGEQSVIPRRPPRGLVCVEYRYRVGKIGVDSPAGWVATVDGASGAVFVQRFAFEPGKDYPDGSSVEFWQTASADSRLQQGHGDGGNAAENPYVFESEVLSPFVQLEPGQSYTWRYEWYATNIGGDFPVVGCNDAGVIAEPLRASRTGDGWRLTGALAYLLGRRNRVAPSMCEGTRHCQ